MHSAYLFRDIFLSRLWIDHVGKEGRPRSFFASMPRNKNTYTHKVWCMRLCNHSACLTLFPIWLEEAASESYNKSPSGLHFVDIYRVCVYIHVCWDGNTSRLPHVCRRDSSDPHSWGTPGECFLASR